MHVGPNHERIVHVFHITIVIGPTIRLVFSYLFIYYVVFTITTSKEPVCPRVELILKIIIILLIIFLGFIKSKPC